MKKGVFLIILIITSIFLTSCSEKPIDPVENDFDEYYEKYCKFRDIEYEAMKIYEDALEDDSVDGAKFSQLVEKKVIPKYEEYLSKIKGLEFQTDAVFKLNEKLIDASELKYAYFRHLLLLGNFPQDDDFANDIKKEAFTEQLNEIERLDREFEHELKKFFTEYGYEEIDEDETAEEKE